MGEKSFKIYVVFLFAILLLGFVNAEYNLGSPAYNLETEYSPEQGIDASILMQFTNESNSTLFEDSLGNFLTLIELINVNSEFEYSVDSTYGTIDSSMFQNLYLDKTTFKAPNIEGNYSYQLNFSGEEIFTEEIIVISSSQDINNSINEKLQNIEEIELDLEQYDEFTKTNLISALNLNFLKQKLLNLSSEYATATTQQERDNIFQELETIIVPEELFITKTAGALVTFPSLKNIDLIALETASNSSYEPGEEEKYKIVIMDWFVNYIDAKVGFNEFSAYYNGTLETSLNIFNLSINKKESLEYPIYLFIEKTGKTIEGQNYQEQSNYYIFEINENSKEIRFSATKEINFTNIGFFVAPGFSQLSLEDFKYVEGKTSKQQEEQKKWTIFILIMILLLIFGFIVYLILQTWYRRRYEDYLFPNKNDLFNLANYITNSKKRGLDNEQIRENLIKAKWSSEQIRYSIRKYSGRRTGMYEIAMRKTLEKKQQDVPPKTYFQNPPKK